jgi:hypothetical protein
VKETEIGLEHLLLETDLVRRRRPALVSLDFRGVGSSGSRRRF